MQLQAAQKMVLRDGQQRILGEITIERTEGDLILGTFEPAAGFVAVAGLFRDFEEAVNLQALARVDQLDAAIASLGLFLSSPDGAERFDIQDVQIWSDGSISFRRGASSSNGFVGSSSTSQPAKTS
jgi:hypothetical protein